MVLAMPAQRLAPALRERWRPKQRQGPEVEPALQRDSQQALLGLVLVLAPLLLAWEPAQQTAAAWRLPQWGRGTEQQRRLPGPAPAQSCCWRAGAQLRWVPRPSAGPPRPRPTLQGELGPARPVQLPWGV